MRESFLEHGGENFSDVPCRNAADDHIALLADPASNMIASRQPVAGYLVERVRAIWGQRVGRSVFAVVPQQCGAHLVIERLQLGIEDLAQTGRQLAA